MKDHRTEKKHKKVRFRKKKIYNFSCFINTIRMRLLGKEELLRRLVQLKRMEMLFEYQLKNSQPFFIATFFSRKNIPRKMNIYYNEQMIMKEGTKLFLKIIRTKNLFLL